MVEEDPLIVLAINAFAGIILQTLFWNKYIGKEVMYMKKPILIPFLIALAFGILIFLLTAPAGLWGFTLERLRNGN